MRYHYAKKARENAQILRKNLTDAERVLWKRLRSRQLAGYKFRRQFPIDSYILDFYCPEHRIAIELDGSQHIEEQHAHDEKRLHVLQQSNIRVLRFWNNDVLNNIDGVLQEIVNTVNLTLPLS
ncbi:endonuclease domain-containing protein [Candidatus Uhrbacteria bacterium]|nr:endonuclease domain-containing protein [Candidatus Uhrbacteria bacterium]